MNTLSQTVKQIRTALVLLILAANSAHAEFLSPDFEAHLSTSGQSIELQQGKTGIISDPELLAVGSAGFTYTPRFIRMEANITIESRNKLGSFAETIAKVKADPEKGTRWKEYWEETVSRGDDEPKTKKSVWTYSRLPGDRSRVSPFEVKVGEHPVFSEDGLFRVNIKQVKEFRMVLPGDTDEDHDFDQLDLVKLLDGGKYNRLTLASWDQGDFNFDGLFNQKDIVLMLQHGEYLQGPYAALAIPEPSAAGMVVVGLLALLLTRCAPRGMFKWHTD